MKISIMQPAYAPPASYFRLMAATDLLVILDDVQFDRRWYTHRQKLTTRKGAKEWMTLPIRHTSRDTTMIKDLEWVPDASDEYYARMRRFSVFDDVVSPVSILSSPVEYIVSLLSSMCFSLGMVFNACHSHEIDTPCDLRGQDRILYICRKLGAKHYINSPGGRHLYDPEVFRRNGIALEFLPEYNGNMDSMFERLRYEKSAEIRTEIYANI